MRRARIVTAWGILVGSVTGAILTGVGLIGAHEPQLVLQLSWFALIFESFNSVQISHDSRPGRDEEGPRDTGPASDT